MLEYDYCLDYTQLKLMSSIKPGNDARINNIHYLKYSNGEVYYRLNHKDEFQNLQTCRSPNFDSIFITIIFDFICNGEGHSH